MNWDQFLDTADRLALGSTEGDWRSAVSRAYYAVFHYFHDFFLTQGLDLGRSGEIHQHLKIGLLNCGIGSVQTVGTQVERLLESRSRADYKLAMTFTQQDADKAARSARQAVADFSAILAGTPAATITAAVRAYLVRIRRIPP